MVKCRTGDREVPGSIPGSMHLFSSSSSFSGQFVKKAKSKGMHILIDYMSF